jgi:[protein-PII] uridylyltransferase
VSAVFDIVELDRSLAAPAPPIAAFRDAVDRGMASLRARFEQGEPVAVLVGERARQIDALITRAWQRFVPGDAGAALVAVGGYGRGELHPASDIDLLLLIGEESDGLTGGIGAFLTFLWDIGLEVGHSVRTVEDCVREAENDLTIATNMMESRLLCGSEPLYGAMCEATGPGRMWPSEKFFAAKWHEQRNRHRKYDDTGYNLEPNIKESPGGLRDIQVIGWVAKRHFGTGTMHGLVEHGFLTEAEHRALTEGQEHLWRIRFVLHVLHGRREDRLLFDSQRALAAEFGCTDSDQNLAVEQFMQSYYRTVMEISRLSEMLLQLFQEAILLHDRVGAPEPINARFQARNGFLEVVDERVLKRYPFALLEIFLLLQQHQGLRGVRASTIRLIRAHRHLIDERFRNDLRCRSLFMEIMRQPRGITHALRRMNRYGILAAYLPAFSNIVGRMQYDLFHVYTVDEHTLFVIRNLRRFTVPRHENEFPLCSEVVKNIPKLELLYLAALFHDIAKGRGGDHSQLGAQDARAFCLHHGLSEYDSGLVAWLVENHLLMSMTAQRKDISDPEVIREFAAIIRDPVRLDYLYLLTVADSHATNPQRWNSWKDALLRELYGGTRHALVRGLENLQAQDELIQEKQAAALSDLDAQGISADAAIALWARLSVDYFLHASPEEIAWQSKVVIDSRIEDLPLVLLQPTTRRGTSEVFVYGPDLDQHFALTTNILDQLGLNIVDARVETADNGFTLNSYLVLEENGDPIDGALREREICQALRAGLTRPERVDLLATRRLPRRLKHFTSPTQVEFSQDRRNKRTVLRLRTTDRPGLLARVGLAFADCGVRVLNAKIATVGAEAEDIFFLTDRQDCPLEDDTQLECLRNALLDRLGHSEQAV